MSGDPDLRQPEAEETAGTERRRSMAADIRASVFGARANLAREYARILSTDGVDRGLLGPREAERIWDRHILNCAAVAELVPPRSRVVDVGSGAGLPGIVLAIRRPDLRIDLVESLRRRTDFLSEVVDRLGVQDTVRVVHGRAEDDDVIELAGSSMWVTARAVAPLDRLVRWCLPLLVPGGRLLAMKGRRAVEELSTHRRAVQRAGGRNAQVLHRSVPGMVEPTWIVSIQRAEAKGRRESR